MYLKNTLKLIQSHLQEDLEASVFLSPSEADEHGEALSPLVDGRVVSVLGRAGRGTGLLRAVLTGSDSRMIPSLRQVSADVVFEVGQFYGRKFPLPTVSWMPDFQHRLLPTMFSPANRLRREIGFRAQIGAQRTLMVSSESSRQDLERFYSVDRGMVHVVPFAASLDVEFHTSRAEEVRLRYGLPRRFFFLPNQFWRHKNHSLIVSALSRLKNEGILEDIMPVVLTGRKHDERSGGYFDELIRSVHEAGVESHFQYLGMIPYEDVLSLNAACDALINPSLIEGWSTPIEEAKALGTLMLLSDRPIHREQAPIACFFDPLSSSATADVLAKVARRPKPLRAQLDTLQMAQSKRVEEHAHRLLATIRASLNDLPSQDRS